MMLDVLWLHYTVLYQHICEIDVFVFNELILDPDPVKVPKMTDGRQQVYDEKRFGCLIVFI